ncbi:MAG: FAD-dependent oxidoreductase [Chloroflexi bacterium]|nr:FAD-dependent oxidoreductase [Chloroflexota bacterium]
MANPLIMAVDDDRAVLNAVTRDLRQKYGREYRVLQSDSGAAALETLKQLVKRGDALALFVADQRMPQMTGVQFLEAARQVFPDAKKVLLTAYADTEAAISSINKVELDYYLMKPWDPPQEHLYPVLDELLEEWKAGGHMPFDGIRVAGTLWSPASHSIKEFLARHQIPYQWLDVDSSEKARALVEDHNQGALKIPTLFFPDGTVQVQPTILELAAKVGLGTAAAHPAYDVIIIGAGPAGLAAAVYASSEGLQTLVIEREAPGGQAGTSPKIENYLGFPSGISGDELTRRAVTQARRFGTEILSTLAADKVAMRGNYRVVTLSDGSEVLGRVVLVTTGASFRVMDCLGANNLTGAGIYYGAAHTEAMYYQDQLVFVIGGANSAAQGAMYLSRFARKVMMLVRGPELNASQYLVDLLQANDKIEIIYNSEIVQAHGQEKLEALTVQNKVTGETQVMPAAAMFVFIGVKPQSQMVEGLVLLDPKGFILTGRDLMPDSKRPKGWMVDRDPFMLETSVPGIFAAGDVRHGTNPRVASATGEGAMAVALFWQYFKTI